MKDPWACRPLVEDPGLKEDKRPPIGDERVFFSMYHIYICTYIFVCVSSDFNLDGLGPCKEEWKGQMGGHCHFKGGFLFMLELNQTKLTILG